MWTTAFSLTRLRAQFIKEVLSVLRDPRSRMVVFVPPILQLLVFAFAATLEVRNVDIAVYNQDAGRWSHELVQRLESAQFITHVRRIDNRQQLHELIDRGEVIAALAIPRSPPARAAARSCWSMAGAATRGRSRRPTCRPSPPMSAPRWCLRHRRPPPWSCATGSTRIWSTAGTSCPA